MSEPETLWDEEPLAEHVARHAYDRLLMLSDGVFAIATTLAALEIRLPEGTRDPVLAFGSMARPLAAYAISFIVIAIFWISHRDLFARIRKVTRGVTVLNLAFLFAISLIPLGISGIAGNAANAGFRVYAVTMLSCGVLNAAMWCYAAFVPGVMRAEVPDEQRITRAIGSWAMPLLFVPIALVPVARFTTAIIPFVLVVLILRRRLLPMIVRRKYAADRGAAQLEPAPVSLP